MILADLKIDGAARKVILHAPKNGFFFVIDRTNGKFISAKNFVDVNWATGYDKNGRPIETPEARVVDRAARDHPGPYGAHNWHPMSFNPQTGLVYMPAQGVPVNLMDDKNWKHERATRPASRTAAWAGTWPCTLNAEPPKSKPFGRLVAWDPVQQKEAWRARARVAVERRHAHHRRQPRVPGHRRRALRRLQRHDRREAVGGADRHRRGGGGRSTYMVDGKQYVSIAVGWGGVYGIMHRATDRQGPGTVYTFAVGGKAPLPDFVEYQQRALLSRASSTIPTHVQEGTAPLRQPTACSATACPGVDRGGNVRNLGYLGKRSRSTNLKDFVFKGPTATRACPTSPAS